MGREPAAAARAPGHGAFRGPPGPLRRRGRRARGGLDLVERLRHGVGRQRPRPGQVALARQPGAVPRPLRARGAQRRRRGGAGGPRAGRRCGEVHTALPGLPQTHRRLRRWAPRVPQPGGQLARARGRPARLGEAEDDPRGGRPHSIAGPRQAGEGHAPPARQRVPRAHRQWSASAVPGRPRPPGPVAGHPVVGRGRAGAVGPGQLVAGVAPFADRLWPRVQVDHDVREPHVPRHAARGREERQEFCGEVVEAARRQPVHLGQRVAQRPRGRHHRRAGAPQPGDLLPDRVPRRLVQVLGRPGRRPRRRAALLAVCRHWRLARAAGAERLLCRGRLRLRARRLRLRRPVGAGDRDGASDAAPQRGDRPADATVQRGRLRPPPAAGEHARARQEGAASLLGSLPPHGVGTNRARQRLQDFQGQGCILLHGAGPPASGWRWGRVAPPVVPARGHGCPGVAPRACGGRRGPGVPPAHGDDAAPWPAGARLPLLRVRLPPHVLDLSARALGPGRGARRRRRAPRPGPRARAERSST